jgi:transposase-like protein
MIAPKRVIIHCPYCGSSNIRAGKENDNIIRCTCRSCGALFEFDVVKEQIVKPEAENK